MPLSKQSSSSHIDWCPSRLLCAALITLGVLASISVGLSALPLWLRPPVVLIAFGYGLWLARREARRPVFALCWTADESGVVLTFADRSLLPLSAVKVLVRGPMAQLTGRDLEGRLHRLLWFPDTLPIASRRTLRLASGNQIVESGPALATMAG